MIEAHWSAVRAIYQDGIFPENGVSLALRRAVGFELVGRRRHLGKMSYRLFSGQWRDVLLFERNNRVGIS